MGDHFNHSCTENANHSCIYFCNHGLMTNTLPERIKEIREAHGDNYAQAGKKCGISRQAYEKWENGATQNMKLGHLLKFCSSYSVGVADLLLAETILHYPTYPPRPKLVVNAPTHDEMDLVQGFKDATPERREIMLELARKATHDKLFTGRSVTQ